MTRILVYSDPPWMPTGYGVQTRLLAHGLQSHGYEVEVAAKAALAGGSIQWEGITVHPYATPAVDALPRTVRQVQPDLVVTLCDVWPLRVSEWQALDVPVWSWVPVEREPLLAAVASWCVQPWVTPVPMSPYGAELLAAFDPTVPVGHAYDPTVFFPGSQTEARRRLSLPDGILVGCVAANIGDREQPRKGWPQLLQAWRQRLDTVKHPGHLVIHTNPLPTEGGVDLYEIARSLKLEGTESVMFTQQVVPYTLLADLYRAIDVLVLPTLGEGFGVPIIESMACGIPAVASSWSGCAHLTPWPISDEGSIPVWAAGAWYRIPHPTAIADAVETALAEPPEPHTVAGLVSEYTHDRVIQQWVTLLKEANYG